MLPYAVHGQKVVFDRQEVASAGSDGRHRPKVRVGLVGDEHLVLIEIKAAQPQGRVKCLQDAVRQQPVDVGVYDSEPALALCRPPPCPDVTGYCRLKIWVWLDAVTAHPACTCFQSSARSGSGRTLDGVTIP